MRSVDLYRLRALPLPAALLLVLAAGLTGAGCRSGDTAQAATAGEDEDKDGDDEEKTETAVPVEVVTVGTGSIEAVLKFSSNLIAEEQVRVHAQASRLVRELYVEEGDQVRRDQVLLRLQDEEQQSMLSKARSQYDRADREHARLKTLHTRQLVSNQTFSDSTFDFEQKRIALEDAEREVGYTDVKAPFAGTITNRLVNIGDQISVGQHLFDLVDFNSMKAPIFVPEKELTRLGVGQEARLTAQATGDRVYRGHIERIAPIVDPRSGTVKVTVAIDDRDGLRPGMYVDAALITDRHSDAVLVPKRALVYDKDQVFVFRLGDERRVERVLIEPMLGDKNYIEPRSGLAAGDQIVIAGQAGLKDNALVRLPGDPDPDEDDTDTDGADSPDAA